MNGFTIGRWNRHQAEHIPQKHALMGHYQRNKLGRIRTVVSFVRHPVGYYSSLWRYLSSMTSAKQRQIRTFWPWHPMRDAAIYYLPNFSEWVDRMIEKCPLYLTRLYENYLGPQGGSWVDLIGRLENLQENLLEILRVLGYIIEGLIFPPPKNVTQIKISISSETKHRIIRNERLVIHRFYGSNQNEIMAPTKRGMELIHSKSLPTGTA